jgi:lipoate-protein ligase A
MDRFSKGLVRGLSSLGIAARFRGKNDLVVDGRKIAGLGVYRDPSGGLLFHGSLLLDLDVRLMSRVLVTPFVAITEGELAVVARRTVTVRELVGSAVSLTDLRARVAEGFSQSFEVPLEAASLSAEEIAAAGELVEGKYQTPGWVLQTTSVPDADGAAHLKTPAGRLELHVSMAGRTLKAVQLRGDFFETEEALADLEGRLRWHSTEATVLAATVAAWRADRPEGTLAHEAITRALAAAIEAAGPSPDAPAPYGCFLSPRDVEERAVHG